MESYAPATQNWNHFYLTWIIYHDVAEGILTEFHPWLENNYFEADKNLLEAAKKYQLTSHYPIHFGTMVTGEQFIVDEGRDSINQRFAPLCVDMETASMAHVCHVNKVPFLSVRSITDTADHKGEENFSKTCRTLPNLPRKFAKRSLLIYFIHILFT